GRASIVAFIGLCDAGISIAASLRRTVKGAEGGVAAAAPENPSWQLSFGELRAALADVPRVAPPALIEGAPDGDGHAVLLLPPLLGGDWQMQPLRDFLAAKGYAAYGWTLGPNLGPTERVLQGVERRLDEIRARHGG